MRDVPGIDFEIRSGELAYHFSQITYDRITYLSYRDMILASVFETRTLSNKVRYTFFRNLGGFEEYLKRFKELEKESEDLRNNRR